MGENVTCYVELLDEGVNAWRPTSARPAGDGLYVLSDEHHQPNETWAIAPGSLVRLVRRRLSEGDCMVAEAVEPRR